MSEGQPPVGSGTHDTFDRSLAHWSEAGRREMEDFYALASVDYLHLARARNWVEWFEARQGTVGDRPLTLLDVACGSGKFPSALLREAGLAGARVQPIDYALLDPSRFSIDEARSALCPPFTPGAEYECTLQDLDAAAGPFDIVWATHALYAVPGADLRDALERFVSAIRPGGVGFIAHANAAAHYLRFYDLFLGAFRDGAGTPYTAAEDIADTLAVIGCPFTTDVIAYANGAGEEATAQVEGYLQRCAFDDSVSLEQMQAAPELGAYLAGCRSDGGWRFDQTVTLFSLTS